MTSRVYLQIICFVVVLVVPMGREPCSASPSAARVALVADKTFDLHESPLVSLLEVELSQKDDIQLLERTQISQVLEEQQLSLAGLLQRSRAIQVGQLLRVDAFVLLSIVDSTQERQHQNRLLRVRVTETAHGLRLLDTFEELDDTKLEELADTIVEKVAAIVPKLTLSPGEAIPIGIVDIHRVQLGESYQWLARSLPTMLSARLSKERQIIMLEREDLKILHDEKLLAEGEDTEFWGSAVLVDGYLQRKGVKDIEMNLRLRQAYGEEIASMAVLVDPSKPSGAVEKVTTSFIQQLLDAPPMASWQPQQEAAEFLHQGQLLTNHNRYDKALPLLETAFALQPQNVFYLWALFNNEWSGYAWDLSHQTARKGRPPKCPNYSDLELAEVVSRLVRQIRDGYKSGLLSEDDVVIKWGYPLGVAPLRGGYFMNSVSASTKEVGDINRESRRIWVETIQKALQKKPNRRIRLELAWASTDNPQELIENLKKVNKEFFLSPKEKEQTQPSDKYWPWRLHHSSENFRYWCHQLITPPIHSTYWIKRTQMRDSSESYWKIWVEYLQDLTEVDDPLVKFLSCLALVDNYMYGEEKDKLRKVMYYRQKAARILEKELKTPNEPFFPDIKQRIREEIKRRMTVTELEHFLEPLIEEEDAENLVLWDPGWLFEQGITPDSVGRYVRLLRRIATVLQKHKDNNEVLQALNNIKDTIKNYEIETTKEIPKFETPKRPTIVSVTMLLSKKDWPRYRKYHFQPGGSSFKVRQKDHMLWVAFDENYLLGSFIHLAEIDLATKRLKALWQTEQQQGGDLPNSYGLDPYPGGRITGVLIREQTSYVAIHGEGLMELPRSPLKGKEFLENPKILTEEDGLPSVYLTGMVGNENECWLAYGGKGIEGGLGLYDPQRRNWETVLCSTLRGEPPFNSGLAYKLRELTLFDGQKLLFMAIVYNTISTDRRGLWMLDTNTRELKKLRQFDKMVWSIMGHFEESEQKLWCKSPKALIQFDPRSEKSMFILGAPRVLKEAQRSTSFETDIFFPSWKNFTYDMHLGGDLDLGTSTIHGDKIWARLGRSQIIIIGRGEQSQEAEIINNNILNGDKVLRFISTPYGLVAIGEGTVGLVETNER